MKHILIILFILCCSVSVFAAPLFVWDMKDGGNMTIANEGDGSTLDKVLGNEPCKVINAEIAQKVKYFYFCLDNSIAAPRDGYLILDLYSPKGNLTSLNLEVNQTKEHFCVSTDMQLLSGDDRWVKIAFHFTDFVPLRLLNYINDIRVSCDEFVGVKHAEIYEELPGTIELYDFAAEIKAAVSEGRIITPEGMSYVVGNDASPSHAALFRSMGFTAVDSYSTWQTVEPDEEGKWDWSRWDSQVSILRDAGLKWVPLLCAGPAYANPNWFRDTEEHYPCVCLEHGEKNKIESLWSPYFRSRRERYIAEFAGHFNHEDIDCIKVGIQGDYGEAIYSADGGGWTFDVPGPYHQHHGYWCNDPYALADYKEYLKKKYKTAAALSKAWGEKYTSFDEVLFPFYGEEEKAAFLKLIQESAKGRREFLDFREWYRAAMTGLADDWMTMIRQYFPGKPIYLSTGGFMMPHLGSHFPEQAKAAAKSGSGIRITNEGSDYGKNFSYTRIVASACRHYGNYFCYEPAGEENFWGIPARIYNAAASGASQLHDYYPNVISARELVDQQQKHLKYLKKREPITPIAVFYPDTYLSIFWDDYMEGIIPELRDRFDFGQLDESLIEDNALKEYKILVIVHGTLMEESTARRIAAWAKQGGIVYVTGVDKFITPEGKAAPEFRLFPESHTGGAFGKGVIRRLSDWDALCSSISGDLARMGFPVYNTAADGVFYTQTAPDSLLIFNSSKDKAEDACCSYKGKDYKLSVEEGSIGEMILE